MESVTSNQKITFVDAVVAGFRGAFRFAGTATRPEFWYWVLFAFIIRLVTTTVDAFLYPEDIFLEPSTTNLDQLASEMATAVQHSFASTTFLVEVLLLVPTVALTVRRFRDASWKPWLAVATYVGIYGSLAVSLVVASNLLSVLTIAGSDAAADPVLIGGFLTLVAALLVQFSSLLVIVIGATQATRRVSTD